MKKHFLFYLSLLSLTMMSFGQKAKNSGFEIWRTIPLWEAPVTGADRFMSSNYETYFSDVPNPSVTPTEGVNSNEMAVRIASTVLANGDTAKGFALLGMFPSGEGSGGELIFPGGVPLTAGDTAFSHIKIRTRFKQDEENSGVVLLQFKNGGVPLGAGNIGVPGLYAFFLGGEVAEFKDSTFWLNVHFEQAPDEVAIVMSSNNVFEDNTPGKAGDYVEVDDFSIWASNDSLIHSEDFNTWEYLPSVEIPDDWDIKGVEDIQDLAVYKTTDSYSGQFALAMETRESPGGVEPVTLTLGSYNCENSCDLGPGMPVNEGVNSFKMYYKYEVEPGMTDTAFIFVKLFQFDNGSTFNVGHGEMSLPPSNDWTLVEFPINTDGSVPDSAGIGIYSSQSDQNTPVAGSVLKIDDLEFTSIVTSVKNSVSAVNVYPTIVDEYLNLENMDQFSLIQVFNAVQHMVIEEHVSSSDTSIDMSVQPSGVYSVILTGEAGREVHKILVR